MEFDYQVYFRQNGWVPALSALFCLVLMLRIIYVQFIKKHYDTLKSFFVSNLKVFFGLSIFLFLAIINIANMAHGGIYLFFEKENDAVVFEGVIEETFEYPSAFRLSYPVEQNNGYGEGIIIQGEKYYLMTYGDLKKGDRVLIKVLPKSKYILEINLMPIHSFFHCNKIVPIVLCKQNPDNFRLYMYPLRAS